MLFIGIEKHKDIVLNNLRTDKKWKAGIGKWRKILSELEPEAVSWH